MSPDSNAGLTWLVFALMTVASWGVYGVFLHAGQIAMGDPVNGRYKAFLFVGIAYFLTAVVAPAAILWSRGADWGFPVGGALWSLLAGTVGRDRRLLRAAGLRRQGLAGVGDVDHLRRRADRQRGGGAVVAPAGRRARAPSSRSSFSASCWRRWVAIW